LVFNRIIPLSNCFPTGGDRQLSFWLGETRSLHNASGAEVSVFTTAQMIKFAGSSIDKFLTKRRPPGWRVKNQWLEHVSDGRYHAWIERDSGGRNGQELPATTLTKEHHRQHLQPF
jgi:hypothetical protein